MLTVLICCFPMTYLLFSFHYDLYHKIEIHQYYSQDQIFQSTAQTISPTQHHTTQHSIHNTTLNTQYHTALHYFLRRRGYAGHGCQGPHDVRAHGHDELEPT